MLEPSVIVCAIPKHEGRFVWCLSSRGLEEMMEHLAWWIWALVLVEAAQNLLLFLMGHERQFRQQLIAVIQELLEEPRQLGKKAHEYPAGVMLGNPRQLQQQRLFRLDDHQRQGIIGDIE